jgi:hypothetical protein
MIVTMACKQPQQDLGPATIDQDAEIPTRWMVTANDVTSEKSLTVMSIVAPDVANYPASRAFPTSTWKIYVVGGARKYKSNIFG